MRKFGLFLCLSLLFAFTGCSDSDDVEEQGGAALAKPAVAVTSTTSSSFKVAWEAVSNAVSYKYQLSQENETGDEITVQPEMSTSATALTFTDLNPKTKYILRVKAIAGSGLTDSDYAKIFVTTTSENAEKLTFEKIAVSNITYESADVEIVPAAENLYYWQVVENSLIDGKSDREIVTALKNNITELTSGTVKKTVHGLNADTQYTIVAFGYDLDANKSTSAVARLETAFTTESDSRMTIAISVGTIAETNVHVVFTPSTANGDYFADVVADADIAGKSEMEIVALLQAKYGAAMTDIARKGKYEGDFTIEKGKNYMAVAFGYDTTASELTTKLFTAEIKNGGGEPGVSDAWVNMTCIYGKLPNGSPAVGTKLMPNSDTKTIKVLAYRLSGSASSLDQIDMTEESLRKNLISEGEVVTELEEGGYQAAYQTTYGQVWLFASIGVDADGNAGGANWMIVQSQASDSAKPSILGMSDKNDETGGSQTEVSDAWASMVPSYEESVSGDYAIFVEFTPNDKTAAIRAGAWTYTGSGNPTTLEDFGVTEADLREMTLGSSGADVDMSKGYIGLGTDPNKIWLFSNVAKTSEGTPGKANWIIVKIPATTSGELTILGQHPDNNTGGGSITLKDASFSDYIGNWTLTSSASMIISGNQVSSSSEPATYNLKIEENVKDKSYKVYGWSADSEFANANPFVMNYDAAATDGISGWITIPLAQKLLTEGNIDWTLCPRFIGGNSSGSKSYYFYDDTDMDKAFFGATEATGAVIIMGNSYGFNAPIGNVDILAMSFVGIDNTNPNANVQLRPLENKHAVGPYVLVKEGSSPAASAAKRMQINRKAANISRIVTMHQNFARLSSASAIGNSFTNLMKRSTRRELAPIPVRKVNAENGYGLRPYYSR